MREVVLLVVSLTMIVSAEEDADDPKKILCGEDFYNECKRLTEEYGASKSRRATAGALDLRQQSEDSAEDIRIVRGSRAKRNSHYSDKFRPLSLGVMKETCCQLGCNERFLLYTCH